MTPNRKEYDNRRKKKSFEDSLILCKEKFINYDFSDVIFLNIRKDKHKQKIVCKLHNTVCYTTLETLKKSKAGPCKECRKISINLNKDRNTKIAATLNRNSEATLLARRKTYFDKASKKHANKYIYIKETYFDIKSRITIICTLHGEFTRLAAEHLKGAECPDCNENAMTPENLIRKGVLKYKNKFTYPEVLPAGVRDNIYIICPVHMEITTTLYAHIHSKHGCIQCAKDESFKERRYPFEKFKSESNLKHSNFYTYVEDSYTKLKNKVDIICPVEGHGLFSQRAAHHRDGSICPKCYKEQTGWWDKDKFLNHCNNKGITESTFYILRCFNENEEFYKLGITSRTLRERYNGDYHMPYNYEIIQEIKSLNEIVHNLETFLKAYILYNNLKYTPKKSFGGSYTECFSV